jgi:hypothetical protein
MSTGLFLDSALSGRSRIYKVVKIASYHKGSRIILEYALKKIPVILHARQNLICS